MISIKWAMLGDAGTKFFHANATIRHRGNLTEELETKGGEMFCDHAGKEQMLWESFKDRLGKSDSDYINGNPTPFI
jgi:hypothetical protein